MLIFFSIAFLFAFYTTLLSIIPRFILIDTERKTQSFTILATAIDFISQNKLVNRSQFFIMRLLILIRSYEHISGDNYHTFNLIFRSVHWRLHVPVEVFELY